MRYFALALALTACSGSVGSDPPAPSDPTTSSPPNSDDPFTPAASPLPEADSGSVVVNDAASSDDTASVDDTTPVAEDAAPATDTSSPPPPPPPAAAPKTEYAPYFYSWGWDNSAYPFTSLVDMKTKTGVTSATLAFVLSKSGTCEASRTIPNHLSDINAFTKAGGRVKASFGGADGTYLESACSSSTAMANAIIAFVDETGITDLDFDVERSVAMTTTVNARRSAALAEVQAKRPAVKVSFTLAAMPTGLTSAALDVVKSAVASSVSISHVNLMTMDYGTTYSAGKTMGDLAIAAINGAQKQLKATLPGLSDEAAYQMIGATPMIGQNDVPTEVFTLADAKTLIAFAKSKHLGLVAFWAIQRDVPCAGAVDLVLCSAAETAKYQFSEVFKTVL